MRTCACLALLVLVASCGDGGAPRRAGRPLERVVRRLDWAQFSAAGEAPRAPVVQIGNETREVLGRRERRLLTKQAGVQFDVEGRARFGATLPPGATALPDSAFVLSVQRAPELLPDPFVRALAGADVQFVRRDGAWRLARGEPDGASVTVTVTASPADEGTKLNVRLESFEPTPRTLESRAFDLPAGARVELGYALANPAAVPVGTRVEFGASLACRGVPPRDLHHGTIETGSAADAAWHEASAVLETPARGCRLRLATTGTAGDLGDSVWTVPRVLAAAAPEEDVDARSLVLISLDTLRADHLSGYGYARATSPAIDRRLVDAGTTFTDVSTTYPMTHVAHVSLFTGLYPAAQPALGFLPREAPARTLAEALRDAGFETAAFTEDALVGAAYGFAFGFERFVERPAPPHKRVRETFADGIHWLRAHRERKFFLFLHTYQVHRPYECAEAYHAFFREEDERVRAAAAVDVPPGERAALDAYDRCIRETDDVVAELLDEIDRLELGERTVVVLLSDHGEAFGEHGVSGHGLGPHQEQLQVPLVVRGPGIPRGRRVAAPGSLVDVAPTLLALLGAAPLEHAQGASLLALLRGDDAGAPRERPLYFQWGADHARGVRLERWKFVQIADRGQLFDLAADPRERTPVTGAPPAERMARELLARYEQGIPAVAGTAEGGAVVPERTEKALRALGYVQ